MNQTDVKSLDFIPEVVEKMQARGVSGVTYATGDFLNYELEDNSKDVIIDKGSFDAICLDTDEESEDKYTKYLVEQIRVLDASSNGRLMIVTLLQAHVLDALLNFFIRGKNNPYAESHVFDFQINKLDKITNVEESKFVSFLLIVTKRARSGADDKSKLSLKANL